MKYHSNNKGPHASYVVDSDNILYVDVDSTLVTWLGEDIHQDNAPKLNKNELIIDDPYTPDLHIHVKKHLRHISLLKRNKLQGRTVVVWSMGGSLWARNVVDALELEDYVDIILSKPIAYVDDLPMNEWGVNRIYLEDR